ncbi:MAG: lipoprotein insertase outer membrane protein LolB [Halioglobus sp.]
MIHQRQSLNRLAIAAVFALLGACTTPAPVPTTPDHSAASAAWAAQQQKLTALKHWQTSGKIALRSDQASESARLNWRQRDQQSDIKLNGPLGMGAMNINSDGKTLVVEQGKEQRVFDISTPEAIYVNTGWQLPLQALPYWLKGLPSPDYAVTSMTLNTAGDSIESLAQDGWLISYSKYTDYEGLQLPARLVAEREDIRLKVILQTWRDLIR